MSDRCYGPVQPRNSDPLTEEAVDMRTLVVEQGHIYVHCYFPNGPHESLIRIWKSTFLIDRSSGVRAGLIHAENISYAPVWTRMPANRPFRFLLVFSGLPASCTFFDLVEEIPEPGGFFVGDILRNERDVYHVDLA